MQEENPSNPVSTFEQGKEGIRDVARPSHNATPDIRHWPPFDHGTKLFQCVQVDILVRTATIIDNMSNLLERCQDGTEAKLASFHAGISWI